MLISFSSRTCHLPTLPKVPKAGSMIMVLLGWIGQQTRLTWTMVVGTKRKMRDTRPNNADDLKAAIKASWASLHLSSATDWSPPCHAALMQYFMQKEAQPSIECIEMNTLFRSLTFLFKIIFFYWSYVIFRFSETLNFGFSLSVRHNHQHFKK